MTVSVMPYAASTRKPNAASSSGTTSPKTPTRSELAGLSGAISAVKTKGISEMWVTSRRTDHVPEAAHRELGLQHDRAADAEGASRCVQLCALTWKNGR